MLFCLGILGVRVRNVGGKGWELVWPCGAEGVGGHGVGNGWALGGHWVGIGWALGGHWVGIGWVWGRGGDGVGVSVTKHI
jgi:hypothetical protein